MKFNPTNFWWTFLEWQTLMWPHIYGPEASYLNSGLASKEATKFIETEYDYWFWEALNNYGGVLDIDEDELLKNDEYLSLEDLGV